MWSVFGEAEFSQCLSGIAGVQCVMPPDTYDGDGRTHWAGAASLSSRVVRAGTRATLGPWPPIGPVQIAVDDRSCARRQAPAPAAHPTSSSYRPRSPMSPPSQPAERLPRRQSTDDVGPDEVIEAMGLDSEN